MYLKSHSRGEYVFDTPGPTPGIGPAASTIRSCRSACRSRRRPAAGCSRVRRDPTAERQLMAACVQVAQAVRGLVTALDVPAGSTMAHGRRTGSAAARRPAVPLAQPRLLDVRRLPCRPRVEEAQEPQARAPRGGRRRHRYRMGHRGRHQRTPLGCVLRLLHRHRQSQMGQPLSDAASSSASPRRRWPTASC